MRTLFLKCLLYLFGILPLRISHAMGTALGILLFVVPNRRQRTARTNIELCFPELNAAAREQLLRRNLIEMGKSVFEVGKLWTRGKKSICRLVQRSCGEERLHEELKKGKGVILAMPHLGAWEMVTLYCSMQYPLTALYQPPPIESEGCFIRKSRERFGARLVPTDNNGVRALYKAIERGEIVAILPDQVPSKRSGSVFAPFFGIHASTMVLLSRLAIKTGAPVIFAYAERLPHSFKFDLHFLPTSTQINQGCIESSVTAVNYMVEACARARPEQYQWFYKRFRPRPAGEQSFYSARSEKLIAKG